jgi:hypothetical protein
VAASSGHDLLAYSVQVDQVRLFLGINVAVNGIPNGLFELLPRIGFGEDRMAQGTSDVAAFERVFYQKEDFLRHSFVSFTT